MARHHYSLGQVILTLLLVLKANISLQAVGRDVHSERTIRKTASQHPTGRQVAGGFYACRILPAAPRQATTRTTWVLFLDHSTQLGQERTLLILGIRLRNLPPSGQSLSLADMEVIDLVPVVKSDKRVVYEQLKAACGRRRAFLGPSSTIAVATWPVGWRCFRKNIPRPPASTTSPTRQRACLRGGWRKIRPGRHSPPRFHKRNLRRSRPNWPPWCLLPSAVESTIHEPRRPDQVGVGDVDGN